MNSEAKLTELKARLQDVLDISMVNAVLAWDQRTHMPPGGTSARARHKALMQRLYHERFTDARVGKLLDDLTPYAESLPPDHDDACLIRETRVQYEQLVKVPAIFVTEFEDHTSRTFQAWTVARGANDFKAVQPLLEKSLDYTRHYANFFPGYEHIADPLLALSNYGLSANTIRALFANLRQELVALLKAISAQEPVDDSCLRQHFPKAQQYAFAREIITAFGYDFERGRMDETYHPFMIKFSLGDVRITLRADDNHLSDGLFATLHEAGHGIYEQGINRAFEGTVLARGASSGVHESQSRLWENRVGRSRGFWQHYYPKLQAVFPDQLKNVSLETFYRAINRVQGTPIRVQADEVTYNLHIMIRSDLSIELLEGKLAIKDLPEAWRVRYISDLGVTPPDDRDGVMQDIHWFYSYIGGSFEGYTIGNILGAQYYEVALKANPEIPAEIESGEFGTLLKWLTENIYRHGRKFTTTELTERVTGGGISVQPLAAYLKTKFSDIYGLK